MSNRLIKLAAVSYTPAVLGTPAIKARCYYVNVRYYDVNALLLIQAQVSVAAASAFKGARGPLGLIGSTALDDFVFFGGIPFTEVKEKKCDPAIPATKTIPAVTSYDQQIGWNSGGASIKVVAPGVPCYIEFDTGPTVTGVLCGICNANMTTLPTEQTHAFMVRQNAIEVYESGVFIMTSPISNAGRPRMRISRSAEGLVQYWVDETLIYTSAKLNTGYIRMDASLYTANDYVDNPVFADFKNGRGKGLIGFQGEFDTRPRARDLFGFKSTANAMAGSNRYGKGKSLFGFGTSAVPSIDIGAAGECLFGFDATATGAQNVMQGKVPKFAMMASDRPYSSMTSSNGSYTLDATMNMITVNAGGMAAATPLITSSASTMLVGEIGGVDSAPPPWAILAADRPYAAMDGKWGSYYSTSYPPAYADGTQVNIFDGLYIFDEWKADKLFTGSFSTILSLATAFEGGVWLDASFSSGLLILDSVSFSVDLEGMFTSELILSTQSNTNRQRGLQYSVNTVTNAVSCYNDFDFIKFVTTPNGVYGVKEDGVYLLSDGAGNDGEPMEAIIDLGEQMMGSSNPKYISQAFAGIATDGRVFIKLTDDDGHEFVYEVVGEDPVRWATVARGVKSKDWRIQLQVVDAMTVELDNIQFDIGISSRRTRR